MRNTSLCEKNSGMISVCVGEPSHRIKRRGNLLVLQFADSRSSVPKDSVDKRDIFQIADFRKERSDGLLCIVAYDGQQPSATRYIA